MQHISSIQMYFIISILILDIWISFHQLYQILNYTEKYKAINCKRLNAKTYLKGCPLKVTNKRKVKTLNEPLKETTYIHYKLDLVCHLNHIRYLI